MRSKRLFYIILIVSCCFPAVSVFCQPIENHFTHYTTKDGLLGGELSDITQDRTGFLWVGTDKGLSRFDGQKFKTYVFDPDDSTSLRESRVCDVLLDSKGQLWVMTYHWIYLYHPDGEWFEHFPINALAPVGIDHFCVEENGQLIIAGYGSLYKFDMRQKKFSFFNHPGLKPIRFWDYKKDEDGIEWIGTSDGLARYDPKTNNLLTIDSGIWINKMMHNHVMHIMLLPNGYLFASTYSMGIYLVNRKTNKLKHFTPYTTDPHNAIHDISSFNDSIILAASDSGLVSFNLRRETMSTIKPDKLNPDGISRPILEIFKDREGILWIGTNFGMEKYDFKDLNVKIYPQSGIQHNDPIFNKYMRLFKCANGQFLLGGYWGIGIFDPVTGMLKKIDDIRFHDRLVSKFYEDTFGKIWCISHMHWHPSLKDWTNSNNSIVSFNIKDKKPVNVNQYTVARKDTTVEGMTITTAGEIVLTTNPGALKIFDTINKQLTYREIKTKVPTRFGPIIQDHNGSVWIGGNMGIRKIEKDGVTTKLYSRNKNNTPYITDWNVIDIREDKQGIIWFTTKDFGIGRIDPSNDSVKLYSTGDGLPTSWYWNMEMDDDDNLWAQSKIGILNFNVITHQFKLYSEEEGFPKPNDIQSIHYSKYTKKLYAFTPYAIFEIDTKIPDHNVAPPKTYITSVSIFDKERQIFRDKPFNLNYNENFINIQFACLLFHSNQQIKYAYKMEGIDKDWVFCNYKRNAPYTNLPPGNYVFNVKAQSPEGIWNSPTLLSIIIKPPFWETWWFYLAEAILGIAFTYWLIRLYTARKLAKQKSEIEKLLAVSNERTRIAADMHDELGAGLTSIRMLSEIAGGKIDHDITARSEIEKIEQSAINLSENLREIIWTMNTRFDKLDDFIIYIRSYAVEFFENGAIHFQFNTPTVIPPLVMTGELRRNLFLCIKEALNNIVKHSQATEASLTFSIVGNTLIMEIKDNGIGIDKNQINKFGNGLNTMKERLNKFGSDLEIEVKNGTKLIFKINV